MDTLDTQRTSGEDKTVKLTSNQPASYSPAHSRRWLLRGTIAGAAGLSLAGGALAVTRFAHAGTSVPTQSAQSNTTSSTHLGQLNAADATPVELKQFFSILATCEA